jgi:hypothetical protein
MAATYTISNAFKVALLNKEIDINSDSFKLALMNPAFSFNPDSQANWADISSSEISSGNGYSTGGITLISGELVQDNDNNQGVMTWQNNVILGSGGQIADTGAAVIYDDSHVDDKIMGCIDFGADYTILDGMSLKFQSIVLKL